MSFRSLVSYTHVGPRAAQLFFESCRFVSIVVVLTYEYFIFAFADSFWAKQPIVLVFPVELLALAWYLCMVFVRLVNLKIVFMEFLGFWSAIGGIVVAEQLMVSSKSFVLFARVSLVHLCGDRDVTACPSSRL